MNFTDFLMLSHLSGLHSLLVNEGQPQALLDASTGRFSSSFLAHQATFWNFARIDCMAAYSRRTKTHLGTEDLALWRAAGLQVTTDGHLYHKTPDENASTPTMAEDPASRTLIWIVLQILNVVADEELRSVDMVTPPNRNAEGDFRHTCSRLHHLLDTWYETLRSTFRPFAKISRSNAQHADFPHRKCAFR